MIRVVLPYHLQQLAGVGREVEIEVGGVVSAGSIVAGLEDRYPTLRGTIRDQVSGRRRPLVRFFACGEDLSQESLETPLPDAVTSGAEPFLIVGAIAGG